MAKPKKKNPKGFAGQKSKKKSKAPSNSKIVVSYGQLARQARKRQSLCSGSTPALSLKATMASIAVMQDLHEGIPVIKLSARTGDWHRRVLTLSQDQSTLFVTHARVHNELHVSKLPRPLWTPSKGWKASYQRYIDVADVVDVQIGVIGTQVLERAIKPKKRDEIKDTIVTIHHYDRCASPYTLDTSIAPRTEDGGGSTSSSLNLLIENPSHRMALIGALATMKENYRDQAQWIGREILLLRYLWYEMDADQNSLVNEKEFSKICDRLQLHVSGGSATKAFREFLKENKIRGKEITYGECTKLLDVLKGKHAVDEIWKKLFGNAVSVTAKRFHDRFLKMAQGEKKATLQDAKDLIAALNTVELGEGSEPENGLKLEKDRFEEYLRSEWNDAYDPKAQELPKDGLTKPMSAYWISSSHNTFLTGDQTQSRSSVEMYTRALQRGCKCLEISVRDGIERRRGEFMPVIHQDGDNTSLALRLELQQVLLVIHNFLSNHPDTYPVILGIENHCTIPYQEAMAKMLKRVFGVRLFIPTGGQRKNHIPTPEELKGMLVVQNKRSPDPDDEGDDQPSGAIKRETPDFMAELFNKFEPDRAPVPRSFMVGADNSSEQALNSSKLAKSKAKKNALLDLASAASGRGLYTNMSYSKELLEISYFHGTKFKYFEESIELLPSHMHSINETKVVKLVTQYDNNPGLWREYNVSHLTRTYPAASRADSSNYNPILAWAMGCQLVTLNFQTSGPSMILNDGRFRQYGNCGYVEKPETVMSAQQDPFQKKVKIRLLAGSCLPKAWINEQAGDKRLDPYVRVELHDVRITKRGKEQYYVERHTLKRLDHCNGFSPLFNDKGHGFIVQNPGVAMVIFRWMADDFGINTEIANAAIPISCLRKGFRSIQLCDGNGMRNGPFHSATLLAHIIL